MWRWEREGEGGVRMLIDERAGVVDLVVDDDVEILLGGVGRDVGVGE
jgi:hypothetical protein